MLINNIIYLFLFSFQYLSNYDDRLFASVARSCIVDKTAGGTNERDIAE